MLKITHNLGKLEKRLSTLEKQIPFAAAKSLTEIGKRVKAELGNDFGSVFDKPTPYIRNSPFSTTATKTKPETTVGIRDQSSRGASPARYIREHFSGGGRGSKPFELVLNKWGVLPSGWRAIPAAGMKLDGFGNPSRTQLREILGSLRTGLRVAAGRGKRQSMQAYFVVSPGSRAALVPGLWRRIERGGFSTIVPVFLFVSGASYQKSINLQQIAGEVIQREFNGIFARELVNAVKTAK